MIDFKKVRYLRHKAQHALHSIAFLLELILAVLVIFIISLQIISLTTMFISHVFDPSVSIEYSIPYYDAWAESGLNYWNKSHLDNYFIVHGDDATTGDGTHPNTEGYKRYYVPQLISLFEKIMPRG